MKTLSGITKPAKGMVPTIFTIHTRSQEVQVDAENGGGWALPLSKKKNDTVQRKPKELPQEQVSG